jgi:hypothetical protein
MKKQPKEWIRKVYRQAKNDDVTKKQSWLRLRFSVFRRDRFQCQRCKDFYGEDGLQLSAHHIKPRAEGGKNKGSNLITLCLRCHDIIELNPEEIDKCFDVRLQERLTGKYDWRKVVYGGQKRPS